ncbi:PhoX family protein [Ottowia sp.]|uniref:PhoX family protein n=1 Tax=Ottowia sp. TaxID=1898956 RepID=UPI003A8B4791
MSTPVNTPASTPESHYDDNEIVNHSNNPHFSALMQARLNRRGALRGGIGATTAALLGSAGLSACGGSDDDDDTDNGGTEEPTTSMALSFAAVAKNQLDHVTVPEGYQIAILHALGDPLQYGDASWADDGSETPESYARRVGDGHDGMVFFGMSVEGRYDATHSERGLLCVNHEYVVQPYGLHPAGRTAGSAREASEVDKEILAHGVSVSEVRRAAGSTALALVRGSRLNRRITSDTRMVMGGPAKGHAKLVTKWSEGGTVAFGTNNNCACGYTPWGTYLTCEENYLNVLGRGADDNAQRSAEEVVALNRYGLPENRTAPYRWSSAGADDKYARWDSKVSAASAVEDFRNEFNTFGWVVEIDPFRPDSTPVKRTHLGRFNHEGAWPAPAVAGQPIVIYSGDDARGEYIYKFVSKAVWDPADTNTGAAAGDKYLDEGTLYVARFNADGSGDWLALTHGQNGLNASNPLYPFADQGDVVMHARLAADHLGATKMDRPEWGGVNPANHEVYMTLTNNSNRVDSATAASGSKIQVDAANPRSYTDTYGGVSTSSGNVNGHIIRWREGGSQGATRFAWDIFLFGAQADAAADVNLSGLTDVNDFSSPDGLYFDPRGLLWIQTDDGTYTDTTNCMMLAAIPGQVGDGGQVTAAGGGVTYKGANATPDTVLRFLVGPLECEITGVAVTPDGKTLLFNVQHPGEGSADFAANTFASGWPGTDGYGGVRPRSATVVVTRSDGGVIAL